ncbi:MAG: M24 family metallopeptidase [Candidatus Bathyarchaeia archaeon]
MGHGASLEVQEGPSLGKTSKDILKTGNVVTNEPEYISMETGVSG